MAQRKLLHPRLQPLLALCLLFTFMACGSPRRSSNPLTLPCQPNISEVAADRFEERLRPLIEAGGPEVFTLQATCDEVTSFVVQILKEHPGESPLEDPRACCELGRVYVAGRFTNVLPFKFEGMVVAAPHLVDGGVDIEIVRASAGSVSLPGTLLRTLSKTINETLAEWLVDIHFNMIEVGEGQITVSGHR